MDDEVRTFVMGHLDVLEFTQFGKIKCKLTGHEMPARMAMLEKHLAGKRFRKAKEWYSADFTEYEPRIVSHKRDSGKLFCTVTKTTLNRIPAEVEKHVAGRKYQRLLAAVEEKEAQAAERDRRRAEKKRAAFERRKRARQGQAGGDQGDGRGAEGGSDGNGENGDSHGSDSGSEAGEHGSDDLGDADAEALLLRGFPAGGAAGTGSDSEGEGDGDEGSEEEEEEAVVQRPGGRGAGAGRGGKAAGRGGAGGQSRRAAKGQGRKRARK